MQPGPRRPSDRPCICGGVDNGADPDVYTRRTRYNMPGSTPLSPRWRIPASRLARWKFSLNKGFRRHESRLPMAATYSRSQPSPLECLPDYLAHRTSYGHGSICSEDQTEIHSLMTGRGMEDADANLLTISYLLVSSSSSPSSSLQSSIARLASPCTLIAQNNPLSRDGGFVRLLLTRGAGVNVRDAGGVTPLHVACRYKDLGVAHDVLRSADQPAEVGAGDALWCTPLHYACGAAERCQTTAPKVDTEMETDTTGSPHRNRRRLAIKPDEGGHGADRIAGCPVELDELLMRHGAGAADSKDRDGRTLLDYAAQRGPDGVTGVLRGGLAQTHSGGSTGERENAVSA
ncbi:hypothetical protein DL769_009833 [Monosporascus sp. CRB-8-3]|nr:hypothetical protein DL769_009833 [Monosporascus sp. CRB-8-3]